MIGIGIGTHRRRVGVAFDADAQILFDRMTTPPSDARKTLINDLILGLKDDGNWDELDVLVLLAAADSQASLLDFKNLSDGALVNAPAFVVDRGYTGDGATSYINTQYNPTTDAVQYTQNNAALGSYIRSAISENVVDIGLEIVGGIENVINSRNIAGDFVGRINSDSGLSVAIANPLGLNSMRRTANNLEEGFKAGSSLGTQADISQALVNGDFFVLCRNKVSTGAEAFSIRQSAGYFFGSGDINQATFEARIQTYMTGVGANV